jgi:H/ACA ribonucleoprotein complex subunit 4
LEAGEDGRSFLFEARVEGGTYIRKLCSDLGEMIGGAHMGELRRTSAGIFSEEGMFNLFDFKSAVDKWKLDGDETRLREMIISAEDAIRKVLPFVEVEKCAVKALYVGKPLYASNVSGGENLTEGDVFAVFCEDVFIGIYRKSSEEIIFGRSEFVCN